MNITISNSITPYITIIKTVIIIAHKNNIIREKNHFRHLQTDGQPELASQNTLSLNRKIRRP